MSYFNLNCEVVKKSIEIGYSKKRTLSNKKVSDQYKQSIVEEILKEESGQIRNEKDEAD